MITEEKSEGIELSNVSATSSQSDLESEIPLISKSLQRKIDILESQERFVIKARTNAFIRYWDVITIFLLTYTAFVTPLEMAFIESSEPWDLLYTSNRCIDMCFIFDIGLNFFLNFYDHNKGKWINKRTACHLHYLWPGPGMKNWTSSFFVDFVASFPFELTCGPESGMASVLEILRFLRCFKLLRLLRVPRIVERWQTRFGVRYSYTSMTYCILCAIGLSHWGACIWGLCPKYAPEGETSWTIQAGEIVETQTQTYLRALYWSVMTLTTIGYGDVPPSNNLERLVAVGFMFVGGCLYAYIVGSICNIVGNMSEAEGQFHQTMDNINLIMSQYNFPQSVRVEMRRYLIKNEARFLLLNHSKVLNDLSAGSQIKFGETYLSEGYLKNIPYLHFPDPTEEQMKMSLVIWRRFTLHSFPAQEEIAGEYEKAEKLYVVKRGLLATKGQILTRFNVVGLDFIMNLLFEGYRRTYCVMSLTFVDVFVLHWDDLKKVLDSGAFPNIAKKIRWCAIKMGLRQEFIREALKLKENDEGSIFAKKRIEKVTEVKSVQKNNLKKYIHSDPTLNMDGDVNLLTQRTNQLLRLIGEMQEASV